MGIKISRRTRSWIEEHWSTFAILIAVFLLALFLRSYFAFDLATSDGFVLSGGSDSYYHKRIIDAVVQTGRHVFEEPLLNYPTGIHASGRPPLYDWSVAVSGMVFAPMFESVDVSVWYSFIFSTAIWGALTIFPVYFLTREAFGKRAGLIAAFFLAIMPAHIQRSPLTNGDHDAYLLFFVVTAFFFFLKALRSLDEARWVKDWKKPAEIKAGLKRFFAGNRKAMLYAMMSALAITAIALAWKGFAYVIVILLIYVLLELLINRFRNVDSMGILLVFAVAVGVALLLSFPWYASYRFVATWFDVPFYLYLAAMVLGFLFVTTRDYPWTVVLPTIFILFGGGFFVAAMFFPGLANAFLSGAGYFVQTKAYETIAEAQAPNFSQVAISLGAVTYYLSLAGLVWAALQIPRRPQPDYMFVVVWSGAAIFMSLAAARFLFNGAPAFAVTSAWVVAMIIEKLDFSAARRTFAGLKGNKLTALRRSVKIRHLAGALFIAFIIVMPNVWFGVDAAIPIQNKKEFDLQVYHATPDFLKPQNYPAEGQQTYYFGAFGYSLPLKSQYWPAAWSWFSQEDSDVFPIEDRPAFLSWWDYGFESVNEGKHPTVADNFLDGYQLAGNFIMAQSESEAIAYLSARLLEGDLISNGSARALSPGVVSVLEEHGVDVDLTQDTLRFPALFIDDILQNPSRYGPRDTRMDPTNAKFIALKTQLVEALPTPDEQADLYRDLRLATGNSIRYFAIDTRLFPFSGVNTGIFYAPAKLSDHNIHETPLGASIPCDFYDITLVTDQGNYPTCTSEQPPGSRQTDNPRIDYKSMFFNTMLYRAYVGYGPTDLGRQIADGVPGISGTLQSEEPLQGWNLSHFRVVYRTAYYNPFPPQEAQNHTDATETVNLLDAMKTAEAIQSGEAQGTVETRYNAFAGSGVVFLKYYDGAIVEGTVTVADVTPVPGASVTVVDELGVPHDYATTDAEGKYRVLAPFGDVTIVVSQGEMDLKTKMGPTILTSATMTVTDEQAMRMPFDSNDDGMYDYFITQDFSVEGGGLKGSVYLDADGDNERDDDEDLAGTLTLSQIDLGTTTESVTSSGGVYKVENLIPGPYSITVTARSREHGPFDVDVAAGPTVVQDIGALSSSLQVNVTDAEGAPVPGITLTLEDLVDGNVRTAVTDPSGHATITGLLEGGHVLTATGENTTTGRVGKAMGHVGNETLDVVLQPAGTLAGRTRIQGSSAGFITLRLVRDSTDPYEQVITSEETGEYEVLLPAGDYDVYASHTVGGTTYASLQRVLVGEGERVEADLNLVPAGRVSGLTMADEDLERGATVTFTRGQASVRTVSSGIAEYRVDLPPGEYLVSVLSDDLAFYGSVTVSGDTERDFNLEPSTMASGVVYRDMDLSGGLDSGEGVKDALVSFTDAEGGRASVRTTESGSFVATLIENRTYTLSVEAEGFVQFVGETRDTGDWASAGAFSILAENVTVKGSLQFSHAPTSVVIEFVGQEDGALDASATSVGEVYQTSLAPGLYSISIRHDLVADGATRYENLGGESLRVGVGAKALDIDVEVVKRHLIEGNVTLLGTPEDATVEFTGTENTSSGTVGGAFGLYLMEGGYTMRVQAEEADAVFAALEGVQVASPMNLNVTVEPAVRLSGTLNTPTGPIAENVTVSITRVDTGGSIEVVSNESAYRTYVLPGSYAIHVDHPTSVSVGDDVRYVRYVAWENHTILPGSTSRVVNIHLDEELDTITVTGDVTSAVGPVRATLRFTATTLAGEDRVVTSGNDGRFAVAMAPGEYDLYASGEVVPYAFLGNVSILPYEDATLDVQLEDAFRVSGALTYGAGIPTSGTITFAATATVEATAAADGSYESLLPEGIYQVEAEVEVEEAGHTETYTLTEFLNVEADTIHDVELEKVVRRAVDIVWVEGHPSPVKGGGSITYHVAVTNEGNVADSYEFLGIPPREGWTFSFPEDPIVLDALAPSEIVEMTVNAPLDALVNHGTISVRVSSVNDTGASDTVALGADVALARGIDLTLVNDPPQYDGQFIHQRVVVVNSGNADETFTLSILNGAEMATSGWEALLLSDNGTVYGSAASGIRVEANGSVEVEVRFKNAGTTASTEAILLAFVEGARSVDRVFAVSAATPTVSATFENVNVQGPGIALTIEENQATLAALPIAVAVIAVVSLLYIWRRKRRWGR